MNVSLHRSFHDCVSVPDCFFFADVYEPYVARQKGKIDAFNSEEDHLLPVDIDYDLMRGLSIETRDVLKKARPASVVRLVSSSSSGLQLI